MNNWLSENKNQIDYYIFSKDVILCDRKKHLETMIELFTTYFSERSGRRFLDVGCGDGALSRILFDRFPDNEFHLLDGSHTMLEKAREYLQAGNTVFHNDTFENFFGKNEHENYFDFIFSSMAGIYFKGLEKSARYLSRSSVLARRCPSKQEWAAAPAPR